MENTSRLKFAFFGTPDIAVIILDELKKAGYVPALIVTNPDAPVGRKQILTPPPAKTWAEENKVPVIQPSSLKDARAVPELTGTDWDLMIVAAYGKIIPEWLLALPKHGILNVHPSLLPKLRGASPIRSAILHNLRETGVTIMKLDAELDHGPIIAQLPANIPAEHWPVSGSILDEGLARQGGALLASVIPAWIEGTIIAQEQNHADATFCTKINKSMSELAIDPHNLPSGTTAIEYLCTIRAFDGWPETFFMHEGKRIKIKHANLAADGTLVITRIIPEGKNEMDWSQYFR
ncbi:MAG: methionyl-tRNA formyltransferase [Patescibacteria group bacterium]